MKRDEAIALIAHKLLDQAFNPNVDGHGAWDEWTDAEQILTELEKAGMQPPSRPNDYGAIDDRGVVTQINEWEKE